MNEEKNYLVLKYPLECYTLDEVKEIYNGILKIMEELDPSCKIIALPVEWEWNKLTKEELLQLRNMIDYIINA